MSINTQGYDESLPKEILVSAVLIPGILCGDNFNGYLIQDRIDRVHSVILGFKAENLSFLDTQTYDIVDYLRHVVFDQHPLLTSIYEKYFGDNCVHNLTNLESLEEMKNEIIDRFGATELLFYRDDA